MTHSQEDLMSMTFQERQNLYQQQANRSKQRRADIQQKSQPSLSNREAELKQIEQRISERKREGLNAGIYERERDIIKAELKDKQTLEQNLSGESGWYLENYQQQVDSLRGRASKEQLEALEDAKTVFMNKLGSDEAGRELVDEISEVLVEVKHREEAELAERQQSIAERQAQLDLEQQGLNKESGELPAGEPQVETEAEE